MKTNYNEVEKLLKKHYSSDIICSYGLTAFVNKTYFGKKRINYHLAYKLMMSSDAFKRMQKHHCGYSKTLHYGFKIIRSNLGKNTRKKRIVKTHDKPKIVEKQIKEFNERMKEKYSPKKPSTIKLFIILFLKTLLGILATICMGLQIGLFIGVMLYVISLFI